MIRTGRGAVLFTLLLLSGVLTACQAGPAAVQVVTAGPEPIAVEVGGPGVIASAQDVPLVVGFRGTVTSVGVRPGQSVRAGQPLLGISSSGLENVAGRLGTQLQAVKANLSRLRASGAPERLILTAQARVSRAEDTYRMANTGRGEIRAPVDGVVSDLTVAPGSQVVGDQPLLHLLNPGRLTVKASVSTAYQGRVSRGQRAQVRGLNTSPAALPARVTAVSPSASLGGQVFNVVVTIQGRDPAAQIGLNAYVTIPLAVRAPVAVNRLAVLDPVRQPTVFVLDDGRVRQRRVVLGLDDGSKVQVVSGLRPGERVVVTGAQALTDGASVQVDGTLA